MEYYRLTTNSPQTRHSPIIVGERYELAEAVALNDGARLHGGLLAKPEHNGFLLPMSRYGKSSDAALSGKFNFISVEGGGDSQCSGDRMKMCPG